LQVHDAAASLVGGRVVPIEGIHRIDRGGAGEQFADRHHPEQVVERGLDLHAHTTRIRPELGTDPPCNNPLVAARGQVDGAGAE